MFTKTLNKNLFQSFTKRNFEGSVGRKLNFNDVLIVPKKSFV